MATNNQRSVDILLAGAIILSGIAFCTILYAGETMEPIRPPLLFGFGLVGLLLPRIKKDRQQLLGLVPYSFVAVSGVAFVAYFAGGWCEYTISSFALFFGLGVGAILRYRDALRERMARCVLLSGLAVALALILILLYRSCDLRSEYDLGLRIGTMVLAMTSLMRLGLKRPRELFFNAPQLH